MPTARSSKEWRTCFTIFFVTFLPKVVFCLLFAIPFRTPADEFGTIATAAQFAGLEWQDLTAINAYYGGGFTIFFAPLFWLTDDPFIIYRTMCIVCAALESFAGVIAYIVMRDHFGVKNRTLRLHVACTVSYYLFTKTTVIFNEHFLFFFSWVIVWLLLKLNACNQNRKKKAVYSILLVVTLCYSLTLHTRSYLYFIALAAVLAVHGVLTRRWLLSPLAALVSGAGGLLCSNLFTGWVKEIVFTAESRTYLPNSSLPSPHLDLLLDPVSWHTILNILLGQVSTGFIYTAGSLCFGFCVFVWIIVVLFKKRPAADKRAGISGTVINYLLVFTFFALAVIAMIGGQSLSHWLPGAVNALDEGFANTDYNLKVFTYLRYYFVYCSPIFVAAISACSHIPSLLRPAAHLSFFVYLGFMVYWLTCIVPYIYTNSSLFEAFAAFGLTKYQDGTSLKVFVLATAIATLIFFLCYILLLKRRLALAVVIWGAALLFEYGYNLYFFDYATTNEKYYPFVDSSYALVQKLEKVAELPHDVYCLDKVRTSHQSFLTLQFLLNRYHVLYTIDDTLREDLLLFSNSSNMSELLGYDYCFAQLDNNEYVFAKDPNLLQALADAGVVMHPYGAVDETPLIDAPSGYMVSIPLSRFSLSSDSRLEMWQNGSLLEEGETPAANTETAYTLLTHSPDGVDSSEGISIYGPYIDFPAGGYRVSFTMQWLNTDLPSGSSLGFCDVAASTGSISCATANIETSAFADGKEHTISFEFCSSLDKLSDVEFRVSAVTDVQLRISDISYTYVGPVYQALLANSNTYNWVQLFLQDDLTLRPLYFVCDSADVPHVLDDTMRSAFPNRQCAVLTPEQALTRGPAVLLVKSDDIDTIYKLLPAYTVLSKQGPYALLASSEDPITDAFLQAGGQPLSEGNGLNARYFASLAMFTPSDYQISLPAGNYTVTYDIQANPPAVFVHSGTFSLRVASPPVTEGENDQSFSVALERSTLNGNSWHGQAQLQLAEAGKLQLEVDLRGELSLDRFDILLSRAG